MWAIKPEDVISILSHPILTRFHSHILDILWLSRKGIYNHPKKLLQFQKDIILQVIQKLEIELKKLPKDDDNQKAYKYLIRVNKWIMDGVALRLLKFDPNAYRILSDNRTHGYCIDKEGTENELKLLDKLSKEKKNVVLNDITNFLRIGDLTVFKSDGQIELKEVKKGEAKNNPVKKTLSLQEKRMYKAEEMVNKNICMLEGTKQGRIEICPIKAKTFLNNIKTLLVKANRDGVSYRTIDDCIKVSVIDFQTCRDLNINPKEELEKFELFPKNHESMPFSNMDLAFCEHGEFFRSAFPTTVLKLPCKLISDLLCGRKIVTVHFSFTNFYQSFINKGFEVEHDKTSLNTGIGDKFNKRTMPLEKSTNPSAIIIRKNGWYMELPDSLIPRIVYEFCIHLLR